MEIQVTRVAGYALILDNESRLLLCRLGLGESSSGSWTLPGGGIDFGEKPEDAVVREVFEETGLHVQVTRLLDVHDELIESKTRCCHAIRIVYEARIMGGEMRPETDGSTDLCAFVDQIEIKQLSLVELAKRGAQLAWDRNATGSAY